MSTMLRSERWATAGLASIYACRMLGLFMILPVLSLQIESIEGATPFWIGVALGAYGLTQALFQIPFGALSDRFGRKPLIIFGLSLFIIGSLLAVWATNIYAMVAARALQGAGAVGAVLLAFVSDNTRPAVRTKAMAIIGITIGATFSLAMLLGPIIESVWHFQAIFWFCVLLGLLAIIITARLPESTAAPSIRPSWKTLRHNGPLKRLCLSIAALHATLTMVFLALPWQLRQTSSAQEPVLWHYYLGVMLCAVICFGPLLRHSHDANRAGRILKTAVAGLMLAEAIMLSANALWAVLLGMLLFFTLFNLLEAVLPSLVSRLVSPEQKGAALGIYSTSQFGGIFLGGIIGGALFEHYDRWGVLVGALLCALLWQAGLARWKLSTVTVGE